ncbi:glycoside hydrolase family 2 protein [Shewanella sp. C32]|uniref:Glycoside hydrolase family 2 protein n=1 Tax=Shewanella electrica TaxID=515560 RepID=A0ABT2FGV6_9GAMM|nr:glycoside hydrolase family 2 TIM barrel-domain containing protein [Shewanella electrica]MCH1925357.1 glycoside hydrolase family 2 protein [Shewanella electrica]MCS4555182.1 glycoside hydrolase family 2 protein [Shewanella electrica]
MNKQLSAVFFSTFILSACLSQDVETAASAVQNAPEAESKVINFNQQWLFKKSADDQPLAQITTPWESVRLPHTPRLEPAVVDDQWQGIAWYQKTFEAAADWRNKVVQIRFEAAMNQADVWLNEQKVGSHLGGYLPFTLDLSSALRPGTNTLLVRLDNRDNAITGPKPLHLLDFNTYGGLYRGVSLQVKDKLMITDEMLAQDVAGGGVFVTYPQVSAEHASVAVKTQLQNQYAEDKTLQLQQTLLWQGKTVASATQQYHLAAGTTADFTQQMTVTTPALWSPKTPHLYTLQTSLFSGDQLIEQQQRQIGIRSFTFNDQHQLLINGEPAFLRGVNRHQEYPFVGYALSPQADYRDAVKIKQAGFDYVRLSHYPHSPAFMAAADKLGLVLLDAVLGWQYYNPDPAFDEQVVKSCRDLIRRDRNHPSVVAWECSLNETEMPPQLIARLHDTVHQEFPGSYSAGWAKGYDIFLQARQHRQLHYETPTQPYAVSEYGDWEYYAQNAGFNQDSWGDLKEEERSSRQLLNSGEKRLLQQALNLEEAHNDNYNVPAFADGYWVMFDYNRGYIDDLEASGIMSLFRQPKYSYYFFASQRDASEVSPLFSSGPMVHIASQWQPDSSLDVRVFSNADEVALYLNDQLVAQQTPTRNSYSTNLPHPPFIFNLSKFVPGTLRADAIIDGKVVATHQVSTPGKAASIDLQLDTSGVAPVTGSNDVLFVYAQLRDNAGNPLWNNDIPMEATAGGDIEILNQEPIVTSMGQAALLIRIGNTLKDARVTVTAAGLPPATLMLEKENQ